jgi:hypothetical protein
MRNTHTHTHTHSVGRTLSFSLLKEIVHIVTAGLQRKNQFTSYRINFLLTCSGYETMRPSVQQSYFVFGRSWVQIVGPYTGYLDWGISLYSSVPPSKFLGSASDQVTVLSFHILSNLLFSNHAKIRRRTDDHAKESHVVLEQHLSPHCNT